MGEKNRNTVAETAAESVKWSFVGQLVNKIVSPLTQIILAHILAPEAFGVVATITMVTTFSQTISDAGFQKYLIQHEFANGEAKERSANVAFWSNLTIALAIWVFVIAFRNPISAFAGSAGSGNALALACTSLPLNSFISVQMALCQRGFDFELVFKVKLIAALFMAAIAIPLAILGLDYWSLIAGTLAGDCCTAILFLVKFEWHPKFYYSFSNLRSMLSFSLWSLSEAIVLWAISWVGVFVIGSAMSSYYLGIYKNSVSITNNLLSVVESTVMPVFYSGISRMQSNQRALKTFFYKSQRALALFLLPIACGVMLFSKLVVLVLLGPNWLEGCALVSCLALTLSLRMLFCYMSNQTLRAVGKPSFITLICLVYLMFYIPYLVWCSTLPFADFSYFVPCGYLPLIVIELIVVKRTVLLSPITMLRGLAPIALNCVLPMIVVAMLLGFSDSLFVQIACIPIFIIVYFVCTVTFKGTRQLLRSCLGHLGTRSFSKLGEKLIDETIEIERRIICAFRKERN